MPCALSCRAAERMAASSVRVVTSTSAHRPVTISVPLTSGSGSFSGTEEAAGSLAAVLCVPEDALSLTTLDAERSRSRTTVYQVWVAQSNTWGAATQAAASTATTSTAMPMPFFSRISRV